MEQDDLKGWYLNAVQFFKAMGYFSKYSASSDEELARLLQDAVCRQWDEPFPPGAENDPQLADMYLLSTDRERVWCADLESVYPGENAYVRFLNAMAAISRGAFRPQDITEHWKGERGPVEVAFNSNGKRYAFLHAGGDMLDPSIIRMINGAIKEAGIAFAVCDNFGMPSFILVLNRDERARLTARRWKFWPGT